MEKSRAEAEAAADNENDGGRGRSVLIPLSIWEEKRKIAANDMNEYSAPRSVTAEGKTEKRMSAERRKASSIRIFLESSMRNMKARISDGFQPETNEKRKRNDEMIKRLAPFHGRNKSGTDRIDASIERCIPDSASTCDSPESLASSARLYTPYSPVPRRRRIASSPAPLPLRRFLIQLTVIALSSADHGRFRSVVEPMMMPSDGCPETRTESP